MMTRVQKLNAYFEAVRARRFAPGSHDCALYVAGWVRVATGIDHAQQWRGRYTSLSDGDEMLKSEGFESHIELAASILTEIPPALAQIGDLAVVEGRALGIVAADRVFVLRPDGLAHVSRLKAERAFTV